MAIDLFGLATLGNIASSVSGGSGDILKDILGDNPISTAKDKFDDTFDFLFGGPRKFDDSKKSGGDKSNDSGFNFNFSTDFTDLDALMAGTQSRGAGGSTKDIVAQLLAGKYDIGKIR